ncbi:MAG: hypothetical protein COA99_06345 [Moraxellaceae bacterium]|nr:MAG: hypothetical protein COA99_06345 [Moraxellaceae bacterium]
MSYIKIAITTLFLILGTIASTAPALAAGNEPSAPQVVNVNTANAETLAASLKGIGLKKAQAIVAHREQYGDFKTAAELTDVKGIGTGTIAMNQAAIVLK